MRLVTVIVIVVIVAILAFLWGRRTCTCKKKGEEKRPGLFQDILERINTTANNHAPRQPEPEQQPHPPISAPQGWKSEQRCRAILEGIFGVPFPSRRDVDWLVNPATGKNLELDCYNEELQLALEYDGIQHSTPNNKFHRSQEEYDAQRERDRIKTELCAKNGVNLIRVPHTIPYEGLYTFIVERLEALGYVDIED